MEQIRPLTSLSQAELIERIEKLLMDAEVSRNEIIQLNKLVELRTAVIKVLEAEVNELLEQQESICAGGVSLMGSRA